MAVKLEAKEGEPLEVPLEGTEAKVSIPESMFNAVAELAADIPGLGGENAAPVALTVTVFDDSTLQNIGGEGGGTSDDGQTATVVTEVKAALNLDLSFLGGDKISVNGLTEPIALSLPVNVTPGMKCAYFDEEKKEWSTDGVTVDETAPAGALVCLTTHLSLFGAIVQGLVATIVCSQLSLLNLEAIGELVVGTWYTGVGSIIVWCTLLMTMATFVAAAIIDRGRSKRHSWNHAFLLVPSMSAQEEAELQAANSIEENPAARPSKTEEPAGPTVTATSTMTTQEGIKQHGFFCFMGICCWSSVTAAWEWCKESSAIREAVDDIVSNWFANFGELRSTIEGLCEGMELTGVGTSGRALALSHRLMTHMLMSSSRRLTGASLGISDSVIAFIMKDELLHDYLVDATANRIREARAGQQRGGSFHRTATHLQLNSRSQGPPPGDTEVEQPRLSRHGDIETFLSERQASCSSQAFDGAAEDHAQAVPKMALHVVPLGEQESVPKDAMDIAKREDAAVDAREDIFLMEEETTASQPAWQETPTNRSSKKKVTLVIPPASEEPTLEDQPADVVVAIDEAEASGGEEKQEEAARRKAPKHVDWRTSSDPEEVWRLLHHEISTAMVKHVGAHSAKSLPRSIWELFLVQNPIGAAFIFDVFVSCRLRALFFALEVMGSFMLSCLFFQVSGSVKRKSLGGLAGGQENSCDGGEYEGTVGYTIGRIIAVGTGSIFIAGLPVAFLDSLHTRKFKKIEGPAGSEAWRKQLRAWDAQDRIIWVVGLAHLSFLIFFTLLFLANISEEDQVDWALTAIVTLVQDLIGLPLILAFFVPAMGGCLLSFNSRVGGTERRHLIRSSQEELHRTTNIMMPLVQI